MSTLEIRGLRASVGGKEILRGIDLTVSSGEVHAVMGPNGAGKSTLSAVVMGKPGYDVIAGTVTLDGEDVLAMPAWRRAAAGLHLVMQYPIEVPGVTLDDVLSEALTTRGRDTADLESVLRAEAERIGFEERFLHRPLNVDLSGGEKKRNETLQLAVLRPKIAILDELDSGLDIDALRDCARRVEAMSNDSIDGEEPLGVLAITHYSRLLTELRADHVHILAKGRIVASGGAELADVLETDGYAAFVPAEELAQPAPAARPGSLDELFPSDPRGCQDRTMADLIDELQGLARRQLGRRHDGRRVVGAAGDVGLVGAVVALQRLRPRPFPATTPCVSPRRSPSTARWRRRVASACSWRLRRSPPTARRNRSITTSPTSSPVARRGASCSVSRSPGATWPGCRRVPCRTVTNGSSTARRCGRRRGMSPISGC